jgi:hypothetical protein
MKRSTHSVFLSLCILMVLLSTGCASASTPAAPVSDQEATQPSVDASQANPDPEQPQTPKQYTIQEVEKLTGFTVKEPTYLPAGVSFEYATYEEVPAPSVVLYFKIIHEQFGDMGTFFQIRQEQNTSAPADTASCTGYTEGCEVLQLNNVPVVYNSYAGGTEGLSWFSDGISYRLLRTAGEPNKVYQDELVKVVESMQ